MRYYLISGLGAGEEVFRFIRFPGNSTFLPWKKHRRGESLSDYSLRMAEDINSKEPFILVGVSFGGIVCQEIAKFLSPKKIVIISSVKSRTEIPVYIRLAARLGLFHLIPNISPLNFKVVVFFLFGAKSMGEKKFLEDVLSGMDIDYLRWSLSQIGNWQQKSAPENILHIHGKTDYLFPARNLKNVDNWLPGGHFIAMQKAPIISKMIKQ